MTQNTFARPLSTMSDALPPDENPILKAYESFVRETPLVTRYLLQSQAVTWFISFFIDLPLVIGNVLQFTIFKLEVYRVVLSPFICTSLLTLVFAYLSLIENGRKMEHSMGSAAFGLLLLTVGMLVNLLHLVICLILYALTESATWLFLPCSGVWIILFAILSLDCAKASSSSTRRLFFLTIPTRFYPFALLVLFSFLGGLQLAYLLSIGIGVAYQRGFLDILKVDTAKIQRWEQTILETYVTREGWVSNDASTRGDWSEAESSGDMGLFSRLVPQQATQPTEQPMTPALGDPRSGFVIYPGSSTSSTEATFPTSGGRPLGTASRRTPPADPRQARLEALERRLGNSSTSNENIV